MNKKAVPRMWVIRAGPGGQAHDLFIHGRVVGLQDASLGDLRKIGTTREAFYTLYRVHHPRATKTAVPGIGGKFFRFLYEIHTGDVVVYPSKVSDTVYVGVVSSAYRYRKGTSLPHQRGVKWIAEVPKVEISLVARRELGAARTFFEVKRNSVEIKRKARLLEE